ncbi:ABC transporter [Serinicoccus chungangensis]|uniref:ABC-type quaternary amine transporter n=1 Tax=Serinicoccus chungangensis TaxID=767452 RepID=A0A0W8IES0_9MICO|nr:ABC transporter ATP-binding protein [Serinicoccus chungangensis]KUG58363.1 ABC transporter [Serinicoccus chungangensis]
MPVTTDAPRATRTSVGTHAVEVIGVGKSFGPVRALDHVDLHLDDGGFLAVLGPSGCGKTTLLRCLAGFERIDEGRLAVHGRAVALPGIHLPPHRRQVAVVPQEGALFPHLSVADNVGFGLPRRSPRAQRSRRVEECLELVGLAGLGRRMPHELSGGQQQRVALARALAPRPPLVLLDEPFSALDASLRVELRRDVRDALHADGATAILVTHDQGEALSMADQVAVMRDGRVHQVAPPEEVYAAPVDAWVASFVGEADLFPVPGTDAEGLVDTPLGRVEVTGGADDATHVLVRPEQVVLDGHGIPAQVRTVDFHGHDALVTLALDDGTLVRSRSGAHPPAVGARVGLRVQGACRAVPGGLPGPSPAPRPAR